MKKVLFIIMLAIVAGCESRSGHKAKILKDSLAAIHSTNNEPVPTAQTPERPVIGAPKSVAYAIDLNSWNLSIDHDGLAYNVEIDAKTANLIITDKTIKAVKIEGKKVTLLR
jgi:Cu/Ag efflux protein CusF